MFVPFGTDFFVSMGKSVYRAKEPGTVPPAGIITAEIRVKEK